MKFFNHVLEVNFRARHRWSHFKIHKGRERHFWSRGPVYYHHVVWGRLSIIFGQPHLVPVTVCGHCGGEISSIRVGEDDSLDYCADCRTVEGPTEEITTEEYEARNG